MGFVLSVCCKSRYGEAAEEKEKKAPSSLPNGNHLVDHAKQ